MSTASKCFLVTELCGDRFQNDRQERHPSPDLLSSASFDRRLATGDEGETRIPAEMARCLSSPSCSIGGRTTKRNSAQRRRGASVHKQQRRRRASGNQWSPFSLSLCDRGEGATLPTGRPGSSAVYYDEILPTKRVELTSSSDTWPK